MMLRARFPFLIAVALTLGAALLTGCAVATRSAPSTALGAMDTRLPTLGWSGTFKLRIDPATLAATVALPRAGVAQADALDLDAVALLGPRGFQVQAVRFDGAGDLEVTFSHAHPMVAPDLTQPASAYNRCDLGYTGRLVVIADRTTETFFDGDVTLDPTLVKSADGYVPVGQLLVKGATNSAHPYVLLADEAEDNRFVTATGMPLTNGGVDTGTYDPVIGGWQRLNLTVPEGTVGWTGYDFIHAGQSITNTLTFQRAALAAQDWTVTLGFLVKWTDPKRSKTYRFPPPTPNANNFAYHEPYAALDVSRLLGPLGPVVIAEEGGSVSDGPLGLAVRDWDSGATEAPQSRLENYSAVDWIQAGASGPPSVTLDCPALGAEPQLLTLQGSSTGLPGDPLLFEATVTNVDGTAALGDHYGLVRAIDAEAGDLNAGLYRFGLDPTTLVPSPALALDCVTYQTVALTVVAGPPWYSYSPSALTGDVYNPSLLVHDGRPLVLYRDNNPQEIRLLRAQVALPLDPDDWTDSLVVAGSYFLEQRAITAASGVLWIGCELNFEVWALRATVAEPTGPSDWAGHQAGVSPDPTGVPRVITTTFQDQPLLVVTGCNSGLGTDYCLTDVLRPLVPVPAGMADWEVSSTLGPATDALQVDNRVWLGAGFNVDNGDALRVAYSQANQATGFTIYPPIPTDLLAPGPALAAAADGPRLLLARPDQGLVFGRALTPVPASSDDWSFQTLDARPGNAAARFRLLYVGGRPLACWTSATYAPIDLYRATSANPSSAADWAHFAIDDLCDTGQYDVIPLADRPLLGYRSATTLNFQIVIPKDPW